MAIKWIEISDIFGVDGANLIKLKACLSKGSAESSSEEHIGGIKECSGIVDD